MQETKAIVTLAYFQGIGPTRFQDLIKVFKQPSLILTAKESLLKQVLGKDTGEKFIRFKNKFNAESEIKKLNDKKIKVISLFDKLYPKELKQIQDPPICLFVKGSNWKNIYQSRKIAIVGTRKPTVYGQTITKKLVKDLADKEITIVSGLALGIDTTAHQSALKNNLATIAVLGCGIDIIYPAINRQLYNEIAKHGAVVSEFPPGTTVKKGLFISRNRIISGLSQAVIVVQGKQNSGSLITAKYCAEQGRDLFAVAGNITDPNSFAPNLLIQNGAYPIISVADLSKYYNLKSKTKLENKTLNSTEKKIIDLLKEQPMYLEELKLKLGLTTDKLISTLTLLELKQLINKEADGKIYLA
ncbi:MAG: DNA processing protein DprA [Patescibacteria group bacterium]|nr:MAG: DNA processing protein DprA [Patescibacteria group bacterium]